MGVGGVLEGLATANNLSRLSDVPYIFDAVNSAKMGNYGDLIGSVVNAALPIGPALATYSADLNKNEDSDLNKNQFVQGHFGRTRRTWANGLAQGGGIIALAGGGNEDKDRYPTHEEAVAAFNAAYPTPKYDTPTVRGPISQAAHDLMVQFHLLPDDTPGAISPEQQRASVYGTSQIGHADGGIMALADGGSDNEEPAAPSADLDLSSILKQRLAEESTGANKMMTLYQPSAEEQRQNIKSNKDMLIPTALMQTGLTMMASPSGYTGNKLSSLLSNLGAGASAGLGSYTAGQKNIADQQKELNKGLLEAAKYDDLRRTQVTDHLMKADADAKAAQDRAQQHNETIEYNKSKDNENRILARERLKQMDDEFQIKMKELSANHEMIRTNHEAQMQSLKDNKALQDFNSKEQHWSNHFDRVNNAYQNRAKTPGDDLYGQPDAVINRKAYEAAYQAMPPSTRKTLELPHPDDMFPKAKEEPTEKPSTTKPRENSAMPSTPAAQFKYDPITGSLVKS